MLVNKNLKIFLNYLIYHGKVQTLSVHRNFKLLFKKNKKLTKLIIKILDFSKITI